MKLSEPQTAQQMQERLALLALLLSAMLCLIVVVWLCVLGLSCLVPGFL